MIDSAEEELIESLKSSDQDVKSYGKSKLGEDDVENAMTQLAPPKTSTQEDASTGWCLIPRKPILREMDVRMWETPHAISAIHAAAACLVEFNLCVLIAEYAQAQKGLTTVLELGRGHAPMFVGFHLGDTTHRLLDKIVARIPAAVGHYARIMRGHQQQHLYDLLVEDSYRVEWFGLTEYGAVMPTAHVPTRANELRQELHGELLSSEERTALRLSNGYAFIRMRGQLLTTPSHTPAMSVRSSDVRSPWCAELRGRRWRATPPVARRPPDTASLPAGPTA